ncbi:MAG: hypothetical protein ONB46_08735 [candidate division KSB1 bacterium]|nr:hypothetical protein [candidate division KSB1 bacterium]MDZ7365891.1 hypothetical protein [candidate division KSB1 bacterium]
MLPEFCGKKQGFFRDYFAEKLPDFECPRAEADRALQELPQVK